MQNNSVDKPHVLPPYVSNMYYAIETEDGIEQISKLTKIKDYSKYFAYYIVMFKTESTVKFKLVYPISNNSIIFDYFEQDTWSTYMGKDQKETSFKMLVGNIYNKYMDQLKKYE